MTVLHMNNPVFSTTPQVCLNSAKVRLNSGILEKRNGNWDAALRHFHMAGEIESTYCDPTYWIGATLVEANRSQEGIPKLEEALDCTYTARNALDALNRVYVALSEIYQNSPILYLVRIPGINIPIIVYVFKRKGFALHLYLSMLMWSMIISLLHSKIALVYNSSIETAICS